MQLADKLMMAVVVILAATQVYLVIEMHHKFTIAENLLFYIQGKEMLSDSLAYGGMNGLYFPDWGYCVKTRGRTVQEIARTECHEEVHAILYQDEWSYNHFCNMTWWDE